MKKTKEQGITLIALIITIIVMLILVAVSVAVALNGGLFNKATDASTKTEEESILEQIIGSSHYTNNGYINVEDTFEEFVETYGEDNINPNQMPEGATAITFDVTGKRGTYKYTISTKKIMKGEGGTPTEDTEEEETPTGPTEEEETPTGPTLKNLGISNENIGDYIDLGKNIVETGATSDDWQVLYVDGTNVYAILAYYLPNDLIPDGDEGDNIGKKEVGYSVWSDSGRISLIDNYLLNTNKWKSLSNGFSNNVTGGPTGEQLMNSYNAKHGTSYDYKDEPRLEVADQLYVPYLKSDETRGYWLASPSEGNVWYVYNDGNLNSNTPDNGIFGVRPVVCLSSNIQASKTDNVWTLSK